MLLGHLRSIREVLGPEFACVQASRPWLTLPSPETSTASEREPDGKDAGVVVVVIARDGNLEASAKGHQDPAVQPESSKYQARRDKYLLPAILCPIRPKSRIDLDLRP